MENVIFTKQLKFGPTEYVNYQLIKISENIQISDNRDRHQKYITANNIRTTDFLAQF